MIKQYIMLFFGGLILLYMLLVIGTYLWMLVSATLYLRKSKGLEKDSFDDQYVDAFFTKPVSIIVPVYNEAVGVVDTVRSLFSLRYPTTEIIIVNDGSTDNTVALAIEELNMIPIEKIIRKSLATKPIKAIYVSQIYPNCYLVDKENGGKADALNVGINFSSFPYFCSLDGDSILEKNSLLRIMQPIMLSDEEVIASGGNVRIANGMQMEFGHVVHQQLSNNALVVMQVIEYLRAFLMGRIALSKRQMVLVISGAFSVFSKEWVIKAEGYAVNTIGEDMELVVRLQRLLREEGSNKRIEFIADPVCWTEAPETLAVLRKQRRRWHQGLLESLWRHRIMLFNPRYGRIGLVAMPYFLLIECLSPLIELGGYMYVIYAYFMGGIYYEFSLLLILLFIIYGTGFALTSVLFEMWSLTSFTSHKELSRLFMAALTELFWYRPLTLIWRVEGMIHFVLGKKVWGNMERVGLNKGERTK